MEIHSKPFNLEHAKAGAPVQLRRGEPARILCFDRASVSGVLFPIIALVKDINVGEYIIERTSDGKHRGCSKRDYDLVMAPLAVVEGKPVFVGDVLQFMSGTYDASWHDVAVTPDFAAQFGTAYRWPVLRIINVWRNKISGDLMVTRDEGVKCSTPLPGKSWECIKSFEEPDVY